ncbi:GNAT family N-acetyltransferase [Skermania piniformis]
MVVIPAVPDGAAPVITFRRLARADFPRLAGWLATPHVQRRWAHEVEPAAIERDFGGSIDGTEPSNSWIVAADAVPIGFIQDYAIDAYPEYVAELTPVTDLPPGAVSIDYFIGDERYLGRGVGTRLIAEFCARLWARYPAAPCLVVPVNSQNPASWRALAAAGFRLIAVADLVPDVPGDPPAHHLMRLDRERGSG